MDWSLRSLPLSPTGHVFFSCSHSLWKWKATELGLFFFNIYLFGCIRSQSQHVGSFTAVHRLSSCRAQAPEHRGFIVVACGLSCSKACGILVSRLGIEPVSPALRGGFLITGPPGKSPSQRDKWNASRARGMSQFLYIRGSPLGQFCFPGNTWQCLESLLVVTTWRGRRYWLLPVSRGQRHLQSVLPYTRQPSRSKESSRVVCVSLLRLP